jgi:hypothetical protein
VMLNTKSASTQSVGVEATTRYSPGVPFTAHTASGGSWARQLATGSFVTKPWNCPTGVLPGVGATAEPLTSFSVTGDWPQSPA